MGRALHGTASTDGLASYAEIAAELGVTTQRAQQIVTAALQRARDECLRRGISPAMFFDRLAVDSPRCRVEPSTIEIEHRPRAPAGPRRAGP